MSTTPIDKAVNRLPASGITPTVLKALDYVVPGEWSNPTSMEDLITLTTGVDDAATVKRIRKRAVQLFEADESYSRALWLFETVDTVDKVVAAAALANKVGNAFSFLSFLDSFTPKASTTQAIDAALKFVVELVAFGLLHGVPTSIDSAKDFAGKLGDYAKTDLMRLAAWVVIDGVLPLGPDFMKKIAETLGSLDTSALTNNSLFSKISSMLPGSTPGEKQGFIVSTITAASAWISNFVTSKGLTQEKVSSSLSKIIDVADSGLDYLAAALDASTDYMAHTGTQTVARVVVLRAWEEIQEEDEDDDEDYAGGYDEDEDEDEDYEGDDEDGDADDEDEDEADEGRDAWLMAAFCMSAMADGEVSDDEKAELQELAANLPAFSGMSRKRLRRSLLDTIRAIEKDGFESVMAETAEALTDKRDRKEAFLLAAMIQFADGEITEDEDDFLYDFGAALGLSKKRMRKLIDEAESYYDDGMLDDEDDEDDW